MEWVSKMIDTSKLKSIRQQKGFASGSACAKRVGVTSSHYNNIERGHKIPSLPTLKAICDVLEISVNDIWDSTDETLPPIFPVRDDGIVIERSTTKFIFPNTPETYKYIADLISEKSEIVIDPDFQTVIEKWNATPTEVKAKILSLLQETSEKAD
jgi:transcriptional regulator with XRE-family HTH domain